MKSIQNKILSVVIAGLLVITALVSAIAVNMTHEVMHRDADRILTNAAQREAAKINDTLGDVVKSINIMTHYATTEVDDPAKLQDETFCAAYLQRMERLFAEVALNTNGIEGYYMRVDPKWSDGTTGFYKLLAEDGSLQDMQVTDLNKYQKDDKQNVSWYYSVVEAGTGIWLEPYYFPGAENEMITYARPWYVGHEMVGVIGFDMNFDYLVQRINDIAVYENGFAVLLAKDGETVYNQSRVQDAPNPYTNAKVELKNGMYLDMRAEYKDIQRDIHPMLRKIVFAFIAVLFLAIVYTVFVTRRIVGPLKQLTAAAETITTSSGVVELLEVPVSSKDEIGTLARVLTNSYAKIREYTNYINALAYRDPLTGIKNATAYAEAIKELNKDICTGNPKFGVLVADINNLKQTNDRFGHDVGNDLIVRTAKILTETFKDSVVFRIGGDEFAVLLQGSDYHNYHSLLEQLDSACANDCITACESTLAVSVARGIAIFDPSIDHIYEDVFAKADQIMYMHKKESKTGVTV